MTDPSRLVRWMQNNFPPQDYSRNQIRYWMKNNVPAYAHMKTKTKTEITKDWKNFTVRDKEGKFIGTSEPAVKSWLGRISVRLRGLIRRLITRR